MPISRRKYTARGKHGHAGKVKVIQEHAPSYIAESGSEEASRRLPPTPPDIRVTYPEFDTMTRSETPGRRRGVIGVRRFGRGLGMTAWHLMTRCCRPTIAPGEIDERAVLLEPPDSGGAR